jgi:glycerol uptake facilitator-like aquaporin
MKLKGYFLTVLTIALLGSVFNTIAWYVDEQILHEPREGWNYDFENYFFIFIISTILSFFLSLLLLLFIWAVENFRKKFTPFAHLVFPLGVLLFYFFSKAPVEVYLYSQLFYIPGIIGYYLFVYRKLPDLKVNSDLIDQE